MKENIHPKYEKVTITCVCGAVYHTGSTAKLEKTDICSACHPFFTGKTKIMDTEGRIEKFKKKFGTDYTKTKK